MASGESATTIYGFTVKDIDGNEISLEKYRYDFSVPIYGVHFFFFSGKVTLIVNVASQ